MRIKEITLLTESVLKELKNNIIFNIIPCNFTADIITVHRHRFKNIIIIIIIITSFL